MIPVKSRAHRALRDLDNFEATSSLPAEIRAAGEALQPEEEVIGIYSNPPEHGAERVLFTSKGLRLERSAWDLIPYREINLATPTPGDKASRQLTILMKDGTNLDLPVRGGRGRLRDYFPVITFLRHVSKDLGGTG